VLTYAEIMRQTARVVRGFAPLILSVPVLTPRLSSYWVGLVTDVDWRVARPLIDGLKTPVVVENDEIRDLVAVELTPYKTAVKRAINNESPEADDG
jgi:predicted N-formylglutamate amidohydrolase